MAETRSAPFWHTLGNPLTALSIPLFLVAFAVSGFWPVVAAITQGDS